MNDELPTDVERPIELEERAHRLRLTMRRTPGLLDRLQAGREAAERGEVVTLEELDRALAAMD